MEPDRGEQTVSSPIGRALIAARLAGEAAIRERFERAQAEGDLPAGADPKELTDYIRTVVYGMAVKAASGSTRDQLERVIELAIRAWPQGAAPAQPFHAQRAP